MVNRILLPTGEDNVGARTKQIKANIMFMYNNLYTTITTQFIQIDIYISTMGRSKQENAREKSRA